MKKFPELSVTTKFFFTPRFARRKTSINLAVTVTRINDVQPHNSNDKILICLFYGN